MSSLPATPPTGSHTRSFDVAPRRLGRYLVHKQLASGGMASVYLGRLIGPAGFSRAVAIKRLHPHLAHDPQFVGMLLDEARIAARVRHPNVVPTVDVVSERSELFIVMEYVHGESLGRILRRLRETGDGRIPHAVASAIAVGMLAGLHAAHEATSEDLQPLGVVHRDVSPPNVILGADGVPRTVDFGIAMALGRLQVTQDGQLKGKLPYMAPEQLRGEVVDRRVDVWATAVVLWEMLAGRRLFDGDEASTLLKIIQFSYTSPFAGAPHANPALDAVLQRGLALDRESRFPTAMAMLDALEAACPPASAHQLARWLEEWMGPSLGEQRAMLSEIETTRDDHALPLSTRASVRPGAATGARARRPWIWVGMGAVALGGVSALAWQSTSLKPADAASAAPAGPDVEPSPPPSLPTGAEPTATVDAALSANAPPSAGRSAEVPRSKIPHTAWKPPTSTPPMQPTTPKVPKGGGF